MRNLARYNRFGSLLPEVDDFFRSFSNLYDATSTHMPVELYEEEDKLFLNIDVPGIEPEDMEIRVFEDRVTLSSRIEEKQDEGKEEPCRTYYCRKKKQAINYSIGLPAEVDADNVSATFKNGVLMISMAKKKKEEGRIIDIS